MADLPTDGSNLVEQRQQHTAERHRPQLPWYTALNSKRSVPITLGLALIISGLVLRIATHNHAPSIRYVAVTRKIASGRVLVEPLKVAEYRIEITPEMHNAQVIGNFTAYGGSTNAVSAVIMQEAEYANWIKGYKADAFYSSGGEKSADQFAVRLGTGIYFFAISNRLSKSFIKYVYLEVQLVYYKLERH